MNKNTLILLLGGFLILFGLVKPDFTNLVSPATPNSIDLLELNEPTDENIKKEAQELLNLVKKVVSKADAKRLRDLYLDIRELIKLDGTDTVITNTEEIRQANSLAGLMARLDMKNKYSDLSKELKDVLVAAIGDDKIILTPELRSKSLDAFGAMAWALNEGSK